MPKWYLAPDGKTYVSRKAYQSAQTREHEREVRRVFREGQPSRIVLLKPQDCGRVKPAEPFNPRDAGVTRREAPGPTPRIRNIVSPGSERDARPTPAKRW